MKLKQAEKQARKLSLPEGQVCWIAVDDCDEIYLYKDIEPEYNIYLGWTNSDNNTRLTGLYTGNKSNSQAIRKFTI